MDFALWARGGGVQPLGLAFSTALATRKVITLNSSSPFAFKFIKGQWAASIVIMVPALVVLVPPRARGSTVCGHNPLPKVVPLGPAGIGGCSTIDLETQSRFSQGDFGAKPYPPSGVWCGSPLSSENRRI